MKKIGKDGEALMTENEKTHRIAELSGLIILENGGETFRAEETVKRVCGAMNAECSEIIAFPTGMVISLKEAGQPSHTIVKRVRKRCTDLEKISDANDISRKLVSGSITKDEAVAALEALSEGRRQNKPLTAVIAGLSAFFFALMFRGSFFDAAVAFVCAMTVEFTLLSFKPNDIFLFVSNVLAGSITTAIAVISVKLFSTGSYEAIIVGSIMPFVPGLALLNAIRDAMVGDLVSGFSRLGEALIAAISLAVGAGIVFAVYFAVGGSV